MIELPRPLSTPPAMPTRSLARTVALASVVALLALPVTGFAAPPRAAKSHASKQAKDVSSRFYKFDEIGIGGSTHRGQTAFFGRKRAKFPILLKLKKSFKHLIGASSKDLALR